MKLQELVNKLSNLLASASGETDIKIDDKDIAAVELIEVDGVKTITIVSVK